MRFTFLLPAYKSIFLDEALQSIQRQSFADFQVLISDDCSPDNLKQICSPYLKDTRFTYRRNKENMGRKSLVAHWNLLVSMCDTEFLILASDDDVYESHFLQEIDLLTKQYPDIALFRARTQRVDETGKILSAEKLCLRYENPLQAMCSHFGENRIHCIGNFIFRTDVLKSQGGFVDFPLAWCSDDATVLLCMNRGIVNTEHVSFSFRRSSFNISWQSPTKDNARMKIEATKRFYYWFEVFKTRKICPQDLNEKKLYSILQNEVYERVKWLLLCYYPFIGGIDKCKTQLWMYRNNFEDGNLFRFAKAVIISFIRFVRKYIC